MDSHSKNNIRQAVPFFMITDMDASLRFYVDGLGFTITIRWTPRGRIEWCWLQREGAAVMLQEYTKEATGLHALKNNPPAGFSICFICEDALALYNEFLKNGLSPSEPFVGNGMWVTTVKDPDGYMLNFESATDVPEETMYSAWVNR